MSIIDAAEKLVKERGVPLSSREIATEAYQRGLVQSNAVNPVQSLTNTIDKMIREKTTNRLKYMITSDNRRLVAPINWDEPEYVEETKEVRKAREVKVMLTDDQCKIINLMLGSNMASSESEAVNKVFSLGIAQVLPKIKENLMKTIESLEK